MAVAAAIALVVAIIIIIIDCIIIITTIIACLIADEIIIRQLEQLIMQMQVRAMLIVEQIWIKLVTMRRTPTIRICRLDRIAFRDLAIVCDDMRVATRLLTRARMI